MHLEGSKGNLGSLDSFGCYFDTYHLTYLKIVVEYDTPLHGSGCSTWHQYSSSIYFKPQDPTVPYPTVLVPGTFFRGLMEFLPQCIRAVLALGDLHYISKVVLLWLISVNISNEAQINYCSHTPHPYVPDKFSFQNNRH